MRISLEQPACAVLLCRKLYRFFVSESDEPTAELIQPLADELRRQQYAIGHVVGIMLRSRQRGAGSGIAVEARYAHLWTMEGGRGVRVDAYFDRNEALRALEAARAGHH